MMTSVSMLRGQVIVALGQQLIAQFAEVGQLAVEGEAEPLSFCSVMPLERLGVAAVVGAAGGVADMADGRPAGVFLHQAFVLAAMVEPEHLDDAPQLFVRVDHLVAVRVERW